MQSQKNLSIFKLKRRGLRAAGRPSSNGKIAAKGRGGGMQIHHGNGGGDLYS